MSFVFVTKSSVSAVSTLLVVIQHVISSLTIFLSAMIRLSLVCFLVILTLLLTDLLTVADQIPFMYLASLLVL